jgi:drug/metabolite transporter (DMT)-like permease
MTISRLLLILFAVLLLSAGQILFKLASQDIVLTVSGVLPSLISVKLAIALLVYLIAMLLWMIVLKDISLRIAYPFAALAFFFVPTMAYFVLGEKVSWNTYVGALIIAIGVTFSVVR